MKTTPAARRPESHGADGLSGWQLEAMASEGGCG